jgi:hypothetical protein
MPFGSPERSIQDGRPVELYRIQTSAGLEWRFTNAEDELLDELSLLYQPAAVDRDQFQQSQDRRATEMTLRMPYLDDVTDEFAQQYVDKPPEGLTTLTIKRHHLTDAGAEFVQFWEGTIISAAYDQDGQVEVLCRGFKNIFEREGPRARWNEKCRHILYDVGCQLIAADFTDFNVQVDSIASDGVTLTLGANLSSPVPSFIGGKAIKDNGKDYRLIVGQSANVITLQFPFRNDFVAGDLVDLEQGCDHGIGDCQSQFSNIDNYGGFPYTPGLNPFNEGLDKL